MNNLPRSDGPRDWPEEIVEGLKPIGITPYDTLETIKPKLEAAGFRIVELDEDQGGVISTYSLYHAVVVGSDPRDVIRGEAWSETDYAEALAEAAWSVIQERKHAWYHLNDPSLKEPDAS